MIDIIIFDWKRTLYDPDAKSLVDGAFKLLEYVKSENIPVILVGKGGEDMQQEVDRLKVNRYFQKIIFAKGEKDPDVFKAFISDNPSKTVLIGDRVRSELEIGNKLGATTIWVKQGKFATEKPENKNQEPEYTVGSLTECLKLLKTF